MSVLEPISINNGAQPIGIFDSGVGGLSVASQLIKHLPNESLVYYADTIHVPYGGRPLHEIQGFALHICDFLVNHHVKAIVMACNISSAVAIEHAQTKYPDIPIIGVLRPGARSACATGADRIGVLATKGTVDSGAYERAIHEADKGIRVVQVACPKFVPLVEAGEFETENAYDACVEYLTPLADAHCETIILGCTHYPFLIQTLTKAASKLFQKMPNFVDPALETAKIVTETLKLKALLSSIAPAGYPHSFYASSDIDKFRANAPALLGSRVDNVKIAI